MEKPAERALHGLYSEKPVLADKSEYSAKLSARLVQPIGSSGEKLTEWRLAARLNGFPVVPEKAGATPAGLRARAREVSEQEIREWPIKYPDYIGTGILTGPALKDPQSTIVAVDIDVTDVAIAEAVVRRMEKRLRESWARRECNPPKRTYLYRTFEVVKTDRTRDFYAEHQVTETGGRKEDEKGTAVEIFGPNGKITADGPHRTTGRPYAWPEPHQSPARNHVDDVACVMNARAFVSFLDDAEEIFRAAGLRTLAEWAEIKAGRAPVTPARHADRAAESALRAAEKAAGVERGRFEKLTEAQVRALLAYVPLDLDYGDWIRVALAVKAALDDDGEDAFLDWSAGSSKDAPDYSLRTWQGLPEPRDITAGTLFHLAVGFPGFADVRSIAAVEPTFPDRDVSIEEAEAAVEAGIDHAFARAEARIAERDEILTEIEVGKAREKETGESYFGRTLSDLSKPPVVGLPVGTGIGKTRAALRRIATFVQAGRRVLFAVPQHKLSAQVAKDLRDLGVDARVWFGRETRNGDGEEMCLDHDAVKAARQSGAPVQEAACYLKYWDPAKGAYAEFTCPHRASGACLYQRQRAAKPDVWIVAHALLTRANAAIGEVDFVVIDEGCWQTFLPGPGSIAAEEIPAQVSGNERKALRENLEAAAGRLHDTLIQGRMTLDERVEDAIATVETRRKRFGEMIAEHVAVADAERPESHDRPAEETISLRREIVQRYFTANAADIAGREELRLKPTRTPLKPGMSSSARQAVLPIAEGAKFARRRGAMWAALEAFLRDEGAERAGRIDVHRKRDGDGIRTTVRVWPLLSIVKAWQRPTVLLDATMPGPWILGPIFPADAYREIEILPRVSARMPQNVRLRQVIRAPVSERKMTPGRGKDANRNMEALRRFALAEFVAGGRKPTLIASQMAYEAWLKDLLPKGAEIATEHFNNVTGINDHEKVRALVMIGRVLPPTVAVERLAGVLTGRAIEPASYVRVERGIRMRDGTGRGVTAWEHSNGLCEAIRRNICDGEAEQMVGRARAVRRGPGEPVEIVVLADLVLDVAFDEVEVWQAPSDETEMLVEGVVLTNASDRARAYPGVWATAKAAERSIQRGKEKGGRSHPLPYIYSFKGNRVSPLLPIRYKRAGAGQKWWEAAYDPSAVPDPRDWLVARIGPLAGFEIVSREAPIVVEDAVAAFDLRRSAETEPTKKSALLFDLDRDALLASFTSRERLAAALFEHACEEEEWRAAA